MVPKFFLLLDADDILQVIGKYAECDILACGDMRRLVDNNGHVITEYSMNE